MNPSEPRGQCGNVRGMRCLNWAGARLTLVPRLRGVDHQIAGLALETDIPPQLANYTDTIFWPHTQRGGDIASALQIRWAHELGKVGLAIDQSQRTGRRDRMEVTAPAWGGGVGGVNQQIGRIYLQSRGI